MGVPVTYFTVSDASFFPGVVALLNSLQLTGNNPRLVVLDLGLRSDQRQLLGAHARVVQVPARVSGNPLLFKPFPHLLQPEGIVVIIDSDMVVTRSLGDALTHAEAGKICLAAEESQEQRWFPEWQKEFALAAPLRRDIYYNSGFVALSTEHWPEFLGRWWEACQSIPIEQTRARGGAWDQPFWDGDQDAINALLMSEVPPGTVATVPQHVTDVMLRVRVRDRATLACTDRGHPTTILHHTGTPKPWRREAWMRVRRNPYVVLLPRLLFPPDLPLRLPADQVPPWLRAGLRGDMLLRLLSVMNGAARTVVRRTHGPIRTRLRRIRDRLAHER